jgi:hypothetical protein
LNAHWPIGSALLNTTAAAASRGILRFKSPASEACSPVQPAAAARAPVLSLPPNLPALLPAAAPGATGAPAPCPRCAAVTRWLAGMPWVCRVHCWVSCWTLSTSAA